MIATDWKKIKELVLMPHGTDAIYSFRAVDSPVKSTKVANIRHCHLHTCRFQENYRIAKLFTLNFPTFIGPENK